MKRRIKKFQAVSKELSQRRAERMTLIRYITRQGRDGAKEEISKDVLIRCACVCAVQPFCPNRISQIPQVALYEL